ncbi:MAG: DUF885 family protein, partial [Myxococcota bacterium]
MNKGNAIWLLCGLVSCASQGANHPTAPDPDIASRALHEFFDTQWERRLREDPVWASTRGDVRFNRDWADRSLSGWAESHRKDRAALERLESIDMEKLEHEDRVSAKLYLRQLRDTIRDYELGAHLMPLTHRGGVQTLDQLARRIRLDSAEDYDDWLARLKKVDQVIEQTIELMGEGLERGLTHPKIVMQRVSRQIEVQVVSDPSASPFYRPFQTLSDSVAQKEQLQ